MIKHELMRTTTMEFPLLAKKTPQDTLVGAVENAEVADIDRAVFHVLTRLRAATIKEFDTFAWLETPAIDANSDALHYRDGDLPLLINTLSSTALRKVFSFIAEPVSPRSTTCSGDVLEPEQVRLVLYRLAQPPWHQRRPQLASPLILDLVIITKLMRPIEVTPVVDALNRQKQDIENLLRVLLRRTLDCLSASFAGQLGR